VEAPTRVAQHKTNRPWALPRNLFLGEKAPTRAAHDVKIGMSLEALLSENSTPVLLAELIGDASASELHELGKRGPATAGERRDETRHGRVAVTVKSAQVDGACRSTGRAADPYSENSSAGVGTPIRLLVRTR